MGDMIDRDAVLAFVKERIRHATASDLSGAEFRRYEAEEIQAFITALTAVTVGVKPLVWVDSVANTPIGPYQIRRSGEKYRAVYFDRDYLRDEHGRLRDFFDEEDAQAAAQADYEARILAALEPVTQPITMQRIGTGLYETQSDYRLAPHLQSIVEAAKTAPQWDTVNDRLAAPDPAAIRETLLSLPAVYAHQINTGVREVYDPLQRFYRMEDVLRALLTEKPHDRA